MALAEDYPLSGLTPEVLKEIFESAQYDCEFNDDDGLGGVYVPDLYGLYVIAREKSSLIRFFAHKYSTKSLEDIRTFCRSVNDAIYLIRTSSSNEPDDDGDFRVTFSYDLLLYDDAKITPRTIIKVAREIDDYIGYAIEQHDTKSIFRHDSDS
jgi:hypothetical protein